MPKEYKPYQKHLFVCTSGKTCPSKAPVEEMQIKMKSLIREKGLQDKIRVNKSGCLGWCDVAPVAVLYPDTKWFSNIDSDKIEVIINELINGCE